jgi:methyl-accepting chemotaxis protein
MDFEAAIQRHAEWKTKFRSAIAQHQALDPVIISKDNYCELGKWLHREGKTKFGNLSSHADCVSIHAAFHAEAGKVAQTINAKNYVEAESMLESGTTYTNAADKIAAAIMKLKNDAKL